MLMLNKVKGVWSDKPFIVTEFYTKGDGTSRSDAVQFQHENGNYYHRWDYICIHP